MRPDREREGRERRRAEARKQQLLNELLRGLIKVARALVKLLDAYLPRRDD